MPVPFSGLFSLRNRKEGGYQGGTANQGNSVASECWHHPKERTTWGKGAIQKEKGITFFIVRVRKNSNEGQKKTVNVKGGRKPWTIG